ncbi:histidine phosphatase family protein [Desemzia sp. FAM 23989]|uniref:histidine phosphatase family protein n=1 Tax=Desemzia sp. FAM 23989 TaxID=3259523 RepID=UPI003883C867
MSKGCTFYFVRHGQTYFNHYRKIQGWSNTPLTEEGTEDVYRSARGLADVEFDAVYTSDLSRTVQTASIILEENKQAENLKIEMMPEFREVFFGFFEGENVDVAWETINQELNYPSVPEMFAQASIPERMNATKKADPYHDAEDFLTFWTRIEEGLMKLISKHRDTGDKVLVVAHGNTIRYLLNNLVAELENPQPLLNASVSIASYQNGAYHLEKYNEVRHFKDLKE